jgi:TonB family protein
VRCLLEIDERGVVGSVRVVHSSGSPLLDEAARAALLAWKYKPATRGGAPRACILEHVVTFRLPRAD